MKSLKLHNLASFLDGDTLAVNQYCYKCDKVQYTEREHACTVARDSRRRRGVALRPYPCPHGNGWHLTSMKGLEDPKHRRRRRRKEHRADQKRRGL